MEETTAKQVEQKQEDQQHFDTSPAGSETAGSVVTKLPQDNAWRITKSPPPHVAVHNLADLLQRFNDIDEQFASLPISEKTQASKITANKAKLDIFKTLIKAGIMTKEEVQKLLLPAAHEGEKKSEGA